MKVLVLSTAAIVAFATSATSSQAADLACLITESSTNPFYMKMKEGAESAAAAAGLDFQAYAGKVDGDYESQIAAVESCIAYGAKGILITPSNDSVGPALKAAREAGILVISLDTPLADAEAQDMTFATDDFQAGLVVGRWAAATIRTNDPMSSTIGLISGAQQNVSPCPKPKASKCPTPVGAELGFLQGFGIELDDPEAIDAQRDQRIVDRVFSDYSASGGQKAMESLLERDPDINVVFTISESVAEGAYQALRASGKEGQTLIVSLNGSCPGVDNVKAGVIGATAQQYPMLMASKGIDAIAEFARSGTKPVASDGLTFFNTGVNLVSDKPTEGVPSIDTAKGLELCWG